ncbi:MAG: cell division inhibitor SulA [Parashewanella sp.]
MSIHSISTRLSNSTSAKFWPSDVISKLDSSNFGASELKELSAQLAQLSLQGRWIVLINPNQIDYKSILLQAGVQMSRVLLVHTKDEVETLWAMEKALISGTSSAVVCWTSELDHKDSRRLQLVSRSAQAMGIVIQTEKKARLPQIQTQFSTGTLAIH